MESILAASHNGLESSVIQLECSECFFIQSGPDEEVHPLLQPRYRGNHQEVPQPQTQTAQLLRGTYRHRYLYTPVPIHPGTYTPRYLYTPVPIHRYLYTGTYTPVPTHRYLHTPVPIDRYL